jgi:hypothetical protein
MKLRMPVLFLTALVTWAATTAEAAVSDAQKCQATKLKLVGKFYKCRVKAQAKFVNKGNGEKLQASLAVCEAKLSSKFSKAEEKWGAECPTTGDFPHLRNAVTADVTNMAMTLSGGVPLPDGCLSVTGSIECSNDAGAIIPCAGTGQDGALQAGDPFSFTDNGDGTITDHNTGLMWEKKSDDGSVHDIDTMYNWGNAFLMHVFSLNFTSFAGYNDWRLPNIRELVSISDYGAARVPPEFDVGCTPGCTVQTCSCSSERSWSSTTRNFSPSTAYTGGVGSSVLGEAKPTLMRVRAVRGGQ